MKTNTKIPHIKRKTRKITFKGALAFIGRFLLICVIIAPFYYGWQALKWFYNAFLTEVYESGNNGVFGPGYHSWEHSRLSWGKLTFFLFVISVILFFIFR